MTEIDIDSATNGRLDYAMAVAQGWFFDKNMWCRKPTSSELIERIMIIGDYYHPTTDQAQCGESSLVLLESAIAT